ncbi:MAG: hypothetical protein K2H77_06575, partial [Alistipes sp.]|nr:hypothetical protein [Alistipes sp.]
YSLSIFSVIHSSDCFDRPAAGFRHCATGALSDVGTSGWYLSSSPCVAGEGRVGAFALYAVSVHPLTVTNRAYGDSVRCVQHLPTAFYLFAGPYLVVPAGCRPELPFLAVRESRTIARIGSVGKAEKQGLRSE